MATPTYNKWKSTTVYGNLSVRDLTNSAGTSVLEVASVDLSGNFLSRGDSTFSKAITCNGTITNSTDLTTKSFVDSAISGLSSVYQTISGMSSYLTTANASSTYATIANSISLSGTNVFTGINNSFTNALMTNSIFSNSQNYRIGMVEDLAGSIPFEGESILTGTQLNVAYLSSTATNTDNMFGILAYPFSPPSNASIYFSVPISFYGLFNFNYIGSGSLASTTTIDSVTFEIWKQTVGTGTYTRDTGDPNTSVLAKKAPSSNSSSKPVTITTYSGSSGNGTLISYMSNYEGVLTMPVLASGQNVFLFMRIISTSTLTRTVPVGDKNSNGQFTPRFRVMSSSVTNYNIFDGGLYGNPEPLMASTAGGAGFVAPTIQPDITNINTSYFYDIRGASSTYGYGLCGGVVGISADYTFTKVPSIILHSNSTSNNYTLAFPTTGIPNGQIVIIKKVNANNIVNNYSLTITASVIVSFAGSVNGSGSSIVMSSAYKTFYFVVNSNVFYLILQL